jgi:hypothetical protein
MMKEEDDDDDVFLVEKTRAVDVLSANKVDDEVT